jgi:signal transduction histidine kinase
MAFVDVRMPPGWDGMETIRHIWQVDPEILIVICTAYSDRSWEDMVAELGRTDRFLVLKKPFDTIEVRQLALALTERWRLARKAELELGALERLLADRTRPGQAPQHADENSDARATAHAADEIAQLHEQLEHARRQAQAAEAAKTDFLTALSNSIKAPTTAIYQFAELLRNDGDLSQAPPSRLRTIDAIKEHAQKLLDTVQPG